MRLFYVMPRTRKLVYWVNRKIVNYLCYSQLSDNILSDLYQIVPIRLKYQKIRYMLHHAQERKIVRHTTYDLDHIILEKILKVI